MKPIFLPLTIVAMLGVSATSAGAAAPDIAGFLDCKVDAPVYNNFAMNLSDDATGYKSLGWTKVDSPTPFLSEYHLPKPITVAGRQTSTVLFSASAMLALLDIADPGVIAAPEGVKNALPSREEMAKQFGLTPAQMAQIPASNQFKGEKIVSDITDPPGSMRFRTTITRVISNMKEFPGKTLVGCSYNMEMLETDAPAMPTVKRPVRRRR